MNKKVAQIFGTIFILIGILGFVPGIAFHGNLFHLFHVNAATNFFHLIIGFIAWWASHTSLRASQFFFRICGVILAAVGLMGFGYGDRDVMGFLANNIADAWFHLITGIFCLYMGFIYKA